MTWNFELVAGPFKSRSGGLVWNGKSMLCSAVLEERVVSYDPATSKTDTVRCSARRKAGAA
jgi:hypothetical protein